MHCGEVVLVVSWRGFESRMRECKSARTNYMERKGVTIGRAGR